MLKVGDFHKPKREVKNVGKPVYAGAALGFYGLAWSVYSNVISRGSEVHFEKNAAIEIRFGTRTPSRASKLLAATRR